MKNTHVGGGSDQVYTNSKTGIIPAIVFEWSAPDHAAFNHIGKRSVEGLFKSDFNQGPGADRKVRTNQHAASAVVIDLGIAIDARLRGLYHHCGNMLIALAFSQLFALVRSRLLLT